MFALSLAAALPDTLPVAAPWAHLLSHLVAACGFVPALVLGLFNGSAVAQACAAVAAALLVVDWRRRYRPHPHGTSQALVTPAPLVAGQRVRVDAWHGVHARIVHQGTVWDVELLDGAAPRPGDYRVAAVRGCRVQVTALPG